jgi:hypothetical protein
MQPARFDLNVGNSSNPTPLGGLAGHLDLRISADSETRKPHYCQLPPPSRVNACYLEKLNLLTYSLSTRMEKSHVETPPHTYFDISLTDVIFNHRLGGKTRNVMCLPAIGVMELAGSPTIVNFDIVSNVTSGLLVKLLIVHGRPAPLSIDPPFNLACLTSDLCGLIMLPRAP